MWWPVHVPIRQVAPGNIRNNNGQCFLIAGDNGTFHSHTTDLLISRGYGIPEEGLRRDMLRMVPINPFEFFSAEGNECDDVEDELSNFFIFEAIRNAFKDEVDHIYFSDIQVGPVIALIKHPLSL
jgi:hypothetical protein